MSDNVGLPLTGHSRWANLLNTILSSPPDSLNTALRRSTGLLVRQSWREFKLHLQAIATVNILRSCGNAFTKQMFIMMDDTY